jgi:DedD protein
MRLFSRNKEAIDAVGADDVPFEALRRSPRSSRNARGGPRATLDGSRDSPPPLDPAESAKTRARRRLIGAVALALAAIVFVPMLFDRTPVATADDISLQIPERDSPFEGRRGVPDATRGPLKASSDLPAPSANPPAPASTTPAPTDAPAPVVTAPEPVISEGADKPVVKSAEPAATAETRAAVIAKPVEKAPPPKAAPTVAPDKPKAAVATPSDNPKALAALEGKTESAGDASGGKTYAVQIAAFSAADKARSLRDQLVANGLKSYTESVSTTLGVRTRVRLGPFASRDAADQAKQKLKAMKLDGSVVPL